MSYDSRQDVEAHVQRVRELAHSFANRLYERAHNHDASKLQEPEKSTFDEWVPVLKTTEFGSPEYLQALDGMGDGLQHHYAENRHHPEHFEDSIAGMTLLDLVEMVCDWVAAAGAKGQAVNVELLAKRFGIEAQLAAILENTLREMEGERG